MLHILLFCLAGIGACSSAPYLLACTCLCRELFINPCQQRADAVASSAAAAVSSCTKARCFPPAPCQCAYSLLTRSPACTLLLLLLLAVSRFFIFQVFATFIYNFLLGSLANNILAVAERFKQIAGNAATEIPQLLGVSAAQTSSFYMSYIMINVRGLLGVCMQAHWRLLFMLGG